MPSEHHRLTDVEQQALLAAWRLGRAAYGRSIRDELARLTGRRLSISAVYTTLVRLEERGLLASHLSDPTPVRGGKSKRYYRLSPEGIAALKQAKQEMERLWQGLDESKEWAEV